MAPRYALHAGQPGRRWRPTARPVPFSASDPGSSSQGTPIRNAALPSLDNIYLRSLLVQSAQYILRPTGPDSELRRWGLKLAASGGKRGKKRAVVAVARKLAVILLSMWRNHKNFEPFPQPVAKLATA